ncbi:MULTISPECIES: hypothetical protein [Rhodopseudomonas]|uniref:Chemotaxis protein n=1 Tax=Rhodopseudomonas palustris TaxID=1076 RepID=A0A0D7EK07_RHOPL|nr:MULTISPECIES: hypothetical protein [Rhodopseudomonas]KIZ40855.1 hypothetical protein OO17_16550 [Rhodopseudomonas palustris]MDF3809392.1 chemotaxis protein [Rhodopseudomonas sp. BAL398]WOK16937.1 chemotaxis protein [Rhodopseudomonas sp. BAL398]
MAGADLTDIAAGAIASIEDLGGQIENAFAQVGGHLGRTHSIFGDLNSGLESLSQELSGSKIEGASVAFQEIAARLRSLVEMLPQEAALLGTIGTGAAQASKLLTLLIKHTGMVSVIARSSRIEAASLEGDRADFVSFTREASDLATSVQNSIVACAKDQEKLSAAIAKVQGEQLQFDRNYRHQLQSVSDELMLSSSDITGRQVRSGQLAESAKASTSRIGSAVGGAIVSLQAGDSTRQRLEHICLGLRMITASAGSIVPAQVVLDPTAAQRLATLQAAQLKDAISGFTVDIASISQTLTRLAASSTSIVGQGHSLYGGEGADANSFFEVMKQRLARATVLISASAQAKQSVDDSLAVLETMLGKFRAAIAELDETVIDITLIGMNAGLKAGHLGGKARAFVVIANELKLSADQISETAKRLDPVLDQIGQAADQLKNMRSDDGATRVADLESQIMLAMREIELGNGRLVQMMDHLTRESAEFESLMLSARTMMATLGDKLANLPGIATDLERRDATIKTLAPDQALAIGGLFDELYLQYTMDAERDVHLKCSGRLGLPHTAVAPAAVSDESEDALFF